MNLDGTIVVHDIRARKTDRTELDSSAHAHANVVECDGRTLLTVGSDRTVRVCDAATGRSKFAPIKFVEGATTLAAFNPDARHILIAAKLGAMVWDLADLRPAPCRCPKLHDSTGSANARIVAAVGSDGRAIWDAITGRVAGPPLQVATKTVQLSPDGQHVAAVGPDHFLPVSHIETGQTVSSGWNAADVTGLTFAPDRASSGVDLPQERHWHGLELGNRQKSSYHPGSRRTRLHGRYFQPRWPPGR